MLQNADILLMDEPTNHLDVMNVKWVKDYIKSLTNVTCIMVSHDSGLLNDVCNHILEIADLKLACFKGNLAAFVKVRPEARAYFELKSNKLKFHFPKPGPIEGVKSKGKALIKVVDVSFKYPRNDKVTIEKATVQVSLSSRVACIGPNGAGKSTLIKCLTGEVQPTTGTVWQHPNARIGYIAQHAFHHIEQHMDKTPNEYIRWRYAGGEDREAIAKDTMKISDAELELQKTVIDFVYTDPDTAKTTKTKRVIKRLTGERKTNKSTKENDYEVQFKAPHDGDDCKHFYGYKKLVKWGWDKACKKVDVKVAQAASGMFRPLTSSNVESHLKNVGLDAEFATHHRISALSGGQKVKVVLGAAMWMQPHLVILDEPTNYLDRESLGALADAIREFEGGVVIISHNNDFTTALCPETWVVEKDEDEISRPNCRGDPEWMKNALATKCDDQQAITEVTDAYGNVTEIKAKKTLTKKEIKKMTKEIKAKIKSGAELDDDEEAFAEEHELWK
jgi:elongation factor 3